MMPKLYKAAEVCDMTQVPAYVLRSWEKEFPGIGVQKSQDSVRLYRQSDIDQVLHIKQLVFAEGLTLAGVRRRLEESEPASPVSEAEVAEVIEALGDNARVRLITVRDGLESILKLLSGRPGSNGKVSAAARSAIEKRVSRAASRSSARTGKSASASLKARPPSKRSTPKVRPIAARAKAAGTGKARRLKTSVKSKPSAKRKRAGA